jgi:hypothetical protein
VLPVLPLLPGRNPEVKAVAQIQTDDKVLSRKVIMKTETAKKLAVFFIEGN